MSHYFAVIPFAVGVLYLQLAGDKDTKLNTGTGAFIVAITLFELAIFVWGLSK